MLEVVRNEELELGLDHATHSLGVVQSAAVFSMLETKKCKFCGSDFYPEAKFSQHESGWKIPGIKEKVWIWFTCQNCGHGWSINHLGVSRKEPLALEHTHDNKRVFKCVGCFKNEPCFLTNIDFGFKKDKDPVLPVYCPYHSAKKVKWVEVEK